MYVQSLCAPPDIYILVCVSIPIEHGLGLRQEPRSLFLFREGLYNIDEIVDGLRVRLDMYGQSRPIDYQRLSELGCTLAHFRVRDTHRRWVVEDLLIRYQNCD